MKQNFTAQVTRVTRRSLNLWQRPSTIIAAKALGKAGNAVAGDFVSFKKDLSGNFLVDEILPRDNELKRSYESKEKIIAANIDRVFIVTAPPPLFNSASIDRIIATSEASHIPVTLILNKLDLGHEVLEKHLATYKSIGLPVISLSLKSGENLKELDSTFADPSLNTFLICGVSGVGKSSLLCSLIPGSKAKVGETSEKSGLGKQTTSLANGYILERSNQASALLIDLPGIQNFGISHLTEVELRHGYTEIRSAGLNCQFSDCSHTKEPKCAVLDALKNLEISESRYSSYLDALEEIKKSKAY